MKVKVIRTAMIGGGRVAILLLALSATFLAFPVTARTVKVNLKDLRVHISYAEGVKSSGFTDPEEKAKQISLDKFEKFLTSKYTHVDNKGDADFSVEVESLAEDKDKTATVEEHSEIYGNRVITVRQARMVAKVTVGDYTKTFDLSDHEDRYVSAVPLRDLPLYADVIVDMANQIVEWAKMNAPHILDQRKVR
jgi:hypothetical protein